MVRLFLQHDHIRLIPGGLDNRTPFAEAVHNRNPNIVEMFIQVLGLRLTLTSGQQNATGFVVRHRGEVVETVWSTPYMRTVFVEDGFDPSWRETIRRTYGTNGTKKRTDMMKLLLRNSDFEDFQDEEDSLRTDAVKRRCRQLVIDKEE